MPVTKSMLFGPVGRQVEVPWPLSGMTSDLNLETETTTLISGEQSVYRAPLAYKSYSMSWRDNAYKLQALVDVYQGVYGRGPYYITDPIAGVQGSNLLPAKWASPHMLEHAANGWANPVTANQTNTPEGRQITFTGSADYPDGFPKPTVVPIIPGSPLYLKVWGDRTGTGSVKVWRYYKSASAWLLQSTVVPTLDTDAPQLILSEANSAAGDIVAIKIVPWAPTGSTLMLQHIDLAVNDYRTYTPYLYGMDPSVQPPLYPGMTLFPSNSLYPSGGGSMFRSGKGIGPVQFTSNLGGSIDSVVIDRIGLSLEVREVSYDPNHV